MSGVSIRQGFAVARPRWQAIHDPRTLLCRSENVEGVDGEEHQGRRKLVAQKPKLKQDISFDGRIAAVSGRRLALT